MVMSFVVWYGDNKSSKKVSYPKSFRQQKEANWMEISKNLIKKSHQMRRCLLIGTV